MGDTTSRATLIVAAKDEASSVLAGISQKAGLDGLNKGLKGVEDGGKGASSSLRGVAEQIIGGAGLSLGVAGLTAGAIGLAKQMVSLAMTAEQNKVAFTTMLGSVEAADAHLKDLRDFAASTPFQFTDLVESSKKLQAFGFEAEKVVPMLRDIGDAVAAMGGSSAQIDRVTLALGQMQSKGKVQAGEMLQLTEAGIPGWRYLAEAVGVSTAEVQKMSEKGLIPAGDAVNYILEGMRKDFGGMMAEQAKTASGQMSNLVDKLESIGTVIGEKMLPATKSAIDILYKAADAVNLLVTMGDKINAVYDEQNDKLVKTSANYDEYVASLLDAAVAAGKSDDMQRKHLLSTLELASTQEVLKNAFNVQSEAIYNATRATEAYGLSVDEDAKLAKLAAIGQEAVTGAMQESKEQMEANKSALEALKGLMAGAVGNELRSFAEKQTELKDKAAEYQAKIDELATKPYLTAQQIQQLEDNKTKLGEVNDALEANATKHEEATKRILFGILEQQAAAGGLSVAEVTALTAVAKNWGLVDAATADATVNISGALADLATNGDIDTFMGKIDDTKNKLLGLPKNISTTFTLNYATNGTPSPAAGDLGLPGGDSAPVTYGNSDGDNGGGGNNDGQPRAFGGPATYGNQYLYNESVYSAPETFVPGTSGAMLTRQQMEQLGANMGGIGGGTINIDARGADDPAAIERAVERALARAGVEAEGRIRTRTR